jgi:hypothetical protein
MAWVVRVLLVALAILGVVTLPNRVNACSCVSRQARLLIPAPGVAHPYDVPFLVEGFLQPDAFLGPARGELQALAMQGRAGDIDLCAPRFFVFGAADVPVTDDAKLILDDQVSPAAVFELNLSAEQHLPRGQARVTISVARSAIDPLELGSGLCDDVPEPTTAVGLFEIVVALSRPMPLFVQATTTDPNVGPIRQFGSTLSVAARTTPSDTVSLQVPVTASSGRCVDVALFDWTLEALWHFDSCLDVGQQEQREASIEAVSADFPMSSPPALPAVVETAGCSLARQRQSPFGPRVLAFLFSVLLSRKAIARRAVLVRQADLRRSATSGASREGPICLPRRRSCRPDRAPRVRN